MITFLSPSSKDLTGHAPEAFIATSACCTRSYLPMTGYMSFHGGGKGTGRGLAVVYRIVTQQEGHITVHCVPGQETTFSKYLPHIPAVGQQAEKHPQTGEQAGGHETILRAEDDAAVRRLTAAVLKHAGYPVITAVNGTDARLRFKSVPSADLLQTVRSMLDEMQRPAHENRPS